MQRKVKTLQIDGKKVSIFEGITEIPIEGETLQNIRKAQREQYALNKFFNRELLTVVFVDFFFCYAGFKELAGKIPDSAMLLFIFLSMIILNAFIVIYGRKYFRLDMKVLGLDITRNMEHHSWEEDVNKLSGMISDILKEKDIPEENIIMTSMETHDNLENNHLNLIFRYIYRKEEPENLPEIENENIEEKTKDFKGNDT